jgi:hypothetical protein
VNTNCIKINLEKEFELMLPSFNIQTGNEKVCGISFEIKGTVGIVAHPDCFKTYESNGSLLQFVKVRNMQYEMQYDKDIFRLNVCEHWQTMNIEAFVKTNASILEYGLRFFGNGEVVIRNIKITQDEFSDNSPIQGPPYVKWINSLNAHIKYEQDIKEFKSQRKTLPDHILPYMELTPQAIIDLVPDRRGLGSYSKEYMWDPRNPDVITDKTTGEAVDFIKDYPVSGYDEIEAPSGEILRYDYHKRPCQRSLKQIFTFVPSYPGPDEDDLRQYYDPEYEKIYLDKFMVSVRMECFYEAALILAEYFNTTGDMEAGIRAAIIFYKITKSIPDWPIFGRPDWNYHLEGFFPPDAYERWFAWIADSYNWYTPATGAHLNKLIKIYENIKNEQIWEQASVIVGQDARNATVQGILHIIRMSLKYDAYYRTDIWKYFHNTMGTQLKGLISAGLSIGSPEVIHYVINKAKSAFGYLFMADSMFPESVAYLHDVAGEINEALSVVEGYSDPQGYIALLDNNHISCFRPEDEIPNYKNVMYLCEHRMFYPDGSVMTIHDTWAESQYSQYHNGGRSNDCDKLNPNARKKSEPFLLPDFGHAIIGAGESENCAEAHIHYSGHYNHSHEDMLNFVLWAYGDELVSDIGYTHLGGYIYTSLSHNLVVVDGQNQNGSSRSGNLLNWFTPSDCSMVMQASASKCAYNQADQYRRAIIGIHLEDGENLFLDIFEVEGGSRHEWMANSCADYTQNAQISIEPYKKFDNLDEYGNALIPEKVKKLGSSVDKHLPNDKPGEKSQYYGAFRNVKVCRNNAPWNATITPAFPDGEDFLGAGGRAKSKTFKPGLRINWVAPTDGEVMLCDAPRHRYFKELTFLEDAMANWNKNVMPKVIVRRNGEALNSTFVALWEPFKENTFVDSYEKINGINDSQGIGVNIQAKNTKIKAFYRKNENADIITSGNISIDGEFLVIKEKTLSETEVKPVLISIPEKAFLLVKLMLSLQAGVTLPLLRVVRMMMVFI